MANNKAYVHLQNLLDNELSSSSTDKKQIHAAYESIINVLQKDELCQQLFGYDELIFACISQIILTPFHQFFSDDQLRVLLELASNARVLSMSQNQIIDSWLQNMEERTFEKPDYYDNDDSYEDLSDDDDDDVDDSGEEDEDEKLEKDRKMIKIKDSPKSLKQIKTNQHQQKTMIIDDSSRYDPNSVASKQRNQPLTKLISNETNRQALHSHDNHHDHDKSKQILTHEPSFNRVKDGRRYNETNNTTSQSKRSNDDTIKRRRGSAFDNKYGVDLRFYDCYICGEYGHVQYDCPKKQDNLKVASVARSSADVMHKKDNILSKSSSSLSSMNTVLNESEQNKIQQVYNQTSKLLNSSQTIEERNTTFESFLSLVNKIQKQHGDNLSKIFMEKESIFYPLFCHVAQNVYFFTNDQYAKLYQLKHILLPQQHSHINADRSIFSRQRTLCSLNTIDKHIKNASQIQQSIFNDFQEHILRSKSPISTVLFDLIKYLIKSSIHVDMKCFEYFTKTILFELKKNSFSNDQIKELQTFVNIRMKRFEQNHQKQIWKERLILFKNDQLTVDLNQWISEFEPILKGISAESTNAETIVVSNSMWYFAVLLMASSGHLNKDQYDYVLKLAIQSPLFNAVQKFYFQFYLNRGQPPVTIHELNQIKIKLESSNADEKKLAYEEIQKILDREKPIFKNEKTEYSTSENDSLSQANDQSKKAEDIIPIIDNHILYRLISLVEMISSDTSTFSLTQLKELLDKFLYQSMIVRPLANTDQQRVKSYLSRPISLNELKTYCSTMQLDLNNLLRLLKERSLMSNEELYDFLIQTIVNIFKNREKYSNEKCQELKDFVTKKIFGKKRYQLINETYEKYRLNKKNLPIINRLKLSELLHGILSQDYQAHLEFFNLLKEISQVPDIKEITIEFEIFRCFLSTIILIIVDADYSNSTNLALFHQRLRIILQQKRNYFLLIFTELQYNMILTRLIPISNLDELINLLKTNSTEGNFLNLIYFIQNDLKDKHDFEKIINLLLYTFDNSTLSSEQTLKLSQLICEHPNLNNKIFKNLVQYLIELLQLNVHSSPKRLLDLIENNQENNQTISQITLMLKAQNGKDAVAEWRKAMMIVLKILYNRRNNDEQLKELAQKSPMFYKATFQQKLESCWVQSSINSSDENKEPDAIPKNTNQQNDSSAAHRELFRYLESNDRKTNEHALEQLRTCLLNEQLPSEISLSKFVQAIHIVIRNFQKFKMISPKEWETLIIRNRGKIFPTDTQCDLLLMEILLVSLNMPTDTLNSLNRLIQSKKPHEKADGLNKLIVLFQTTQMNNDEHTRKILPTISDQFYNVITRVVFDQKFNDHQVRQCLKTAKRSWLLSDDHREKLNRI